MSRPDCQSDFRLAELHPDRPVTGDGFAVPAVTPAAEFVQPGLEAFFFAGLTWEGKPTRVFAYKGVPESASPDNPVPGIVLVHGGGGTAFADWVRLWVGRGYAAIAMDLNGHVPVGQYDGWQLHDQAGPTGIAGKKSDSCLSPFANPLAPLESQWPWHALTAVSRAQTLLRHDPRVDAARVGITGISWGGWLTSLAVAFDHRFRAAAPVYGCGYIHEASCWQRAGEFQAADSARWIELWEPSNHLPQARCPMLWVNGTNDFAYWPRGWFASGRLHPTACTRSMTLRMPHGHGGAGENPVEIQAFMDHHLRRGPAMVEVVGQREEQGTIIVQFKNPPAHPVVRAELLFTKSHDPVWPDRLWETQAAQLDTANSRATVAIPAGATAGFVNLVDARNLTSSSDLCQWPQP